MEKPVTQNWGKRFSLNGSGKYQVIRKIKSLKYKVFHFMERVFVNTVLIVLCLDPLKSPPLNFGIFVIPSKFIPCTNLYYYYLVSVISCKFLPCTSLYYYYFVSVISFKFLPCTNLNYYYLVSVISCKFLLCTSLYYYHLISVISYKFLPCTNLY